MEVGVRGLLRAVLAARGTGSAAAQTMIVRGALIGINALTGVVSARLLGPYGKGAQTAITTWITMATVFANCGVPTALIYYARSQPARAGQFFAAGLVVSTASGVVAAAAAAVAVSFSIARFGPSTVEAAQFFMLLVPFSNLFVVAQGIIETHLRFAVENALVLSTALAALLSMLVLGAVDAATPESIAACYALPGALAALVALVYAIGLTRPQRRNALAAAGRLMSFGIRQYGSDLAISISVTLDILLATSLLAPALVGTYAVAAALCRLLNLVPQSIGSVLLPRLIGEAADRVCSAIARAARVGIAVSVLLALPIAIWGAELIRLVYGANFVIEPLVIWILLAEAILGGAGRLLVQTMTAVGRPGLAALLNATQIALGAPVAIVLMQRFDSAGLAGGILLATVVRLGVTLYCYPRILGVGVPRLILSTSELARYYLRLRATVE